MINLYGWDTVSLSEVSLVNKALSAAENRLITEFAFEEDGIKLSGRFGAWQIVPGGGGQRMNVELPIVSGQLDGDLGNVDLANVTLTLRVILRLLEPPDSPNERHLMFDLKASLEKRGAVDPIKVDDPEGRLSDVQKRALVTLAAACLSNHSDQVSFVFASVKSRGAVATDLLATPEHDWLVLNVIDGPQYIAILGALKRPPGGADAIDTQLINGSPSAVLAVSNSMLASKFLYPSLSESFRPKSKFSVKGDMVGNARHIRLPRLKKGIWSVDLTIEKLTLQPQLNILRCHAYATAPLKLLAKFETTVDMEMPVSFNSKTRQIEIKPDPKPKEHHTVKFPKVLDFLIGWLVRWIMSFFKDAIHKSIVVIAHSFQKFNSPEISTVKWTGIRDFQTGSAELNGGMVLRDIRPADQS